MTAVQDRPVTAPTPPTLRPTLFSNVTPNWFASVMGTGIIANAAATLPVHVVGLRSAATVVWAVGLLWLVALTAATVVHHARYPAVARRHHLDPVMSHFYGAPAMALLTVGAGALLVGRDWIGLRAAVDLDWTLWTLGTLLGLGTATFVPYLMFTRHEKAPDGAFGGWLMPVVPPMVSASTGALLVPYAHGVQGRETLVLGCYALFGLSLFASLIVTALIWARLAASRTGPAKLVPTMWIALGWMGQSITAVNLLGAAALLTVPAPYAKGLQVLGVVYGVPTWGFAVMWTTICVLVTVRTLRSGLPFSLTWWSFTFPVGTFVTGTTGLWNHTGLDAFRYTAVGLYVCLVLAWAVVVVRTVQGLLDRSILTAPSEFAVAA